MELKVVNLSKRFGNQWILRDVDLVVSPGSVVCICGSAGSGKSTLLKLLAGIEKPNGGSVEGISAGGIYFPDHEKGGLLGLFGSSGTSVTGIRALERIEKALESSKGIVLFDEPFAGMDVETQRRAGGRMRQFAKSGKTVVFSAADFRHACEAADLVVVIDRGTVAQTGTPHHIYDEPATAAVARLTGPINLIEARRLTSSNADVPEFHTVTGGHRIFAKPVAKARLGAIDRNMLLGIRPEDVVIAMNASFPEDNVVRACVTGIRFDRETSLVEFDADGLSLTARVFKVVGLNVGDECLLGLPPDRVNVLS
jgi:ABC-type sugar transport system ATPase subunit